ncbi:MAG TPA: DUF3231 family protein, partial [Firmicutes bacterium]|nr:DUF3231 family protein [Bacillota bacterium]
MKNMKGPGVINIAADLGKSVVRKQHDVTVEAGNMWNKLLARYDFIESVLVMSNYIKDEELQKVMQTVLKKVKRQTQQLEKVMAEHAVALMPQPASEIKISEGVPSFTDRYVFLRIFHSIKRVLPVHIVSFEQSTSPVIREMFKGFLLEEMDMYDDLRNFGLKKN